MTETVKLRSFYRIVVVSILSTLAIELALSIFCAVGGYDPMYVVDRWPGIVWPPVAVLVLFLTIGGTAFWIGMIWDCSSANEMSVWSRVVWLLLLIALSGFSMLIYYFCVFVKRPLPPPSAEGKQLQA
jgi:hypothetical protein